MQSRRATWLLVLWYPVRKPRRAIWFAVPKTKSLAGPWARGSRKIKKMTSTTGTKELRNKSLAGSCTRRAEKSKSDVTHCCPRIGYQRTENKVLRRSLCSGEQKTGTCQPGTKELQTNSPTGSCDRGVKINRSKVLSKERQMAVKKVAAGDRFFYGQKSAFAKVSFFARVWYKECFKPNPKSIVQQLDE